MARKSRRKTEVEDTLQNDSVMTAVLDIKRMAAGAYIRLSVERETDDSIENQMALVTEFINAQEDLELKKVYVDNGFTGTNFDRPDFERLMTDCKNGMIQCVVVKDFSRFGRDFIETAYYIETFFSKINVRFLSINDNFDSNREEDMRGIATPLKLLVNEMYAKDTGKKIRKVLEAKRMDGTQKIGATVYGYQVDRENNRFVVDPEAADTVKLIFHWYNHGKSEAEIASALRALNTPTPYVYLYRDSSEEFSFRTKDWDPTKVRNILKKLTYVGDRALGKRLMGKLPDDSAFCDIPEDQWIILKDTHEPLVLRDDYEKAREKLKKSKRAPYQESIKRPFTGIVYCGLCGRQMQFGHYKNDYFYSDTKMRNSKGCGNKVSLDYLKVFAMDQIQMLIRTVCDRKELLDQLRKDVNCKKKIMTCKRRQLFLKTKQEKTMAKLEQIFADHADDLISDLDFLYFKRKYMEEKRLIEKELENVRIQEKQQTKIMSEVERMERWLRPFLDDHRFNQELVNELVEKITFYGNERIEISFTCKDVFADFADWFEEVLV